MKAQLSACIIVKNEPLLEQCLQSIRPFVEEIIIVDTGSTDNTPEIAKKYADIFEVYTGYNDSETGLIEDFSNARQRSFDLATKDFLFWLDADDIIEGGEHFYKIIEEAKLDIKNRGLDTIAYLFPYEYSYNEFGQCTCRHYRERFFYKKELYHWLNPVHEVVVPNDNVKTLMITRDDVIFKHKRQYSGKIPEVGRNLRILRKYFEKVGESDARQMYYLGLECCNSGLIEESIKLLKRYIEVSGWDDERVMACLKLVDIYQGLAQYQEALVWAFKSIEINENWSEGYLAVGKMFYFLAQAGGSNQQRNWQRCVHFIKTGLALPPTKTLLFVNPVEREFEIHKYLNVALNSVGDIKGALESTIVGLQKNDDPMLLSNKKLYEKHLAMEQIKNSLDILKNNNFIDDKNIQSILLSISDNKSLNSIFPIYNKSNIYPKNIKEEQFPVAIITPHSQAWGIPNTLELDDLPLRMTKEQLQSVIIMIWRQYILHDEILAAISFLENAPYDVRDSKITQDALNISKKMIEWLQNPALMQKHNAPTNPNLEIDVPMPEPLAKNQSGGRFQWVVDQLPNHKVSIVDFGCVDGCFTNRYAMMGHEVYGLDVVETSVALANKKAKEFKTGAKHIITYFQEAENKVPNNYFNYATSTDTYEHLIDPVKDLLLPAKKMLKKDGKFLLCTPCGAWFRGQYVSYGHPWIWAEEGISWLCDRPRGHLIAPSPWSVAKHFKEAEYYIYNCYYQPSLIQNVENQGNVYAEAYVKPPQNYPGLDIVFFIGDGLETWTPLSIKKTGIGGSELMGMQQAKGLAKLGHKVRVYNSCGEYGEGVYEGVEYYQTNKYQDLKCDILIVSRRADMLDDKYNITAKLKLLWVHDVYALNATNELLLKADKILALSEWHKQNLITIHNVPPEQIIITRNGIDLNRFKNKNVKRDRYKCIYASSPDRALPVLLKVWPKIKQAVPQAHLTIAYGFKNWKIFAKYDKSQLNLIQFLENKIKEMENLGVKFLDRINQDQLAEEYLSSSVCLYPGWFSETSYIGGMECQAAGVRFIGSNIAAIKETIGERGVLIDGEWTSKEYQNEFIENAIKALQYNDDNSDRQALQQYAQINFGLDDLAEDWDKIFYQLIENKKINPLNPYQPTEEYK